MLQWKGRVRLLSHMLCSIAMHGAFFYVDSHTQFTPTLHKFSGRNRYAARYSSISAACIRVANPHVG